MNTTSKKISDPILLLLSLFTCALLMHMGSGWWQFKITIAFIILMAGLQFLNFRLWWATIFAALAFIIVNISVFPRLANHANIELLLSFCFIIINILAYFKKHFSIEKVPVNVVFRVTLVTMYFMAGFHKLNYGFFSSLGSCSDFIGNKLNYVIFGQDFILNSNCSYVFQLLTIIMEMVVPFGILHHKTRKATAVLLVAFHFYLSLCHFSNFSGFAGFMIAGCIIDLKTKEYNKDVIKGLRLYILFTITASVASYLIARFILLPAFYIRFFNGAIFNIGWVVFFYVFIRNINFRKAEKFSYKLPTIFAGFIILWSSQCYIGLSNAGNLTMFSNLITEKSRNNHFLLNTQKTKIWSFEEDYVTIIQIPEKLKWQNSQGLQNYDLPLIEFKTQVGQWTKNTDEKYECTLLYKGKKIKVKDLKNSEFNSAKWWYHYIFFRKIPPNGENECLW